MVDNIILCEGETDQVLIGSYLCNVSNWVFFKYKESPFPVEEVCWYRRGEEILGIWQVGGRDFSQALSSILKRSLLEDTRVRIAIVTDNDDEEAENERLEGIVSLIEKTLSLSIDYSRMKNEWLHLNYENDYVVDDFLFCYILVPWNEHGALETFMLDSLSEQSVEKKTVIEQCSEFVKNFKSSIYLRKRREQIKAKLGVAIAVMSPDKVFTTMNELINSVNWAEFRTAHKQFEKLREL